MVILLLLSPLCDGKLNIFIFGLKIKEDSSGRIFHNCLEELIENTVTSTIMDNKIIITHISYDGQSDIAVSRCYFPVNLSFLQKHPVRFRQQNCSVGFKQQNRLVGFRQQNSWLGLGNKATV